jgi:hypothetical protein
VARVLILCPTFDHADTLFASIASVRAQDFTDWEMAVVLDGSPPRTKAVVAAIAEHDRRVRAYAHPKSARYGELYRDPIIRESKAELVCHLSDDDVFLAGHLASLVAMLERAEWVTEAPLRLDPGQGSVWLPTNYGTAPMRQAIAARRQIPSGLNYVAYRREAYLRLPEGWTCAPWAAGASDLFMWSKFFKDARLTVACTAQTSALKFPSGIRARKAWKPEKRLAEIAPWLARAAEPGLARKLQLEASVFERLAMVFAVHGPGASLDEAFARAALEPAPSSAQPDPALDGAPMILPLTEAQSAEAAEAWRIARAYAAGDDDARGGMARAYSAEPDRWVQGARAIALALGADLGLAALEHCRRAHPRRPGLLAAAARLLIAEGRLAEAKPWIEELASGWPDDRGLGRLRTAAKLDAIR